MNSLYTPLHDWHISRGARMVPFAGWEMPVQYSSVIQEHEATRQRVGLTDVSHMGRLVFDGRDAGLFLDSMLSRNVAAIKLGQIRYSLLTNPKGGIIDDLLVGLIQRDNGTQYYGVVINASNRQKDIDHFAQALNNDMSLSVTMIDLSEERAMMALQGPKALETLQPLIHTDLSKIKYYNGLETTSTLGDRIVLVTRTGYTGEDGFEICVESFFAEQFADALMDSGKAFGIAPVGLGARDTLRLEAAMPLYGHEMSDEINPFEARLEYALHLDGPVFPGSDVLRKLKDKPLQKIRVGLEMKEKRPAREGSEIYCNDIKIGFVSSGSFAPTLQKSIAMGYVPPEFSTVGQTVFVDIRGNRSEAVVVEMPFYKRR